MNYPRLDVNEIHTYLKNLSLPHEINVTVLQTIDSTNQWLKYNKLQDPYVICCAEEQTSGRGRFQRAWYSPKGENIYYSLRCPLPNEIEGLSLVIGLAVIAALKHEHIDPPFTLKWPNDILWEQQKLAGILLEKINQNTLIIGIGLNVHSTTLPANSCALNSISSIKLNRNRLIAALSQQIFLHLQKFTQEGFTPFIPTWQQYDALYGQTITLTCPSGTLVGVAQGVNSKGHLLLLDENGHLHELFSGETATIRKT